MATTELGEFFVKNMQKIKKEKLCCAECGAPLTGHVSEIAHILPKGYFKSIKTHEMNWLPLCGMWSSKKQCHNNFDNKSIEDVKKMKIYPLMLERFKILEKEITEKLTYKHYDLYSEN